MAFVTRKLPALLLATTLSLGLLAPHTAEARDGRNAALLAGALLGLAAGSVLTHSAQAADEGYTVVEPAPRPVYRPRYDVPAFDDEDDYGEAHYRPRPVYRDDGPRYRVVDDAWPRRYARFHEDEGRPCPDRDWRRYDD